MVATPGVEASSEQLRQLAIALSPRHMSVALQELLDPQHNSQQNVAREPCHILDMKFEPWDYCTILYELGKRLVIGMLRWDGHARQDPLGQWITPFGMHVHLFPHDPALPGLPTALNQQAMARLLFQTFPECRRGMADVLHCRVTPLRYRPGKRCTMQVDAWLRSTRTGTVSHRAFFAKLYHRASKATSVYQEMQSLSMSAPVREGQFAVARAVALVPSVPLVVQEPVDGMPLDMWLGWNGRSAPPGDPRVPGLIDCAAAALAAFHSSGVSSARKRPIADELARFDQRASQITAARPRLGAALAGLATALMAWLDRLPEWEAEYSIVHGDCKPSQFMVGASLIGLLDFDHCGIADPASDVGTFIATLRQLRVQQVLRTRSTTAAAARTRWLHSLEQRFLDQYCIVSTRSRSFRLRVLWYEAVALQRKALRSFARSPASPLPELLVAEAWECLRHLPAHRGTEPVSLLAPCGFAPLSRR